MEMLHSQVPLLLGTITGVGVDGDDTIERNPNGNPVNAGTAEISAQELGSCGHENGW